MDFAERRKYYNRCRVDEPLAPDDPRNIDIDRLQGPALRGAVWAEQLATRVRLSDEPVCLLFTGLPGSGKSTELRRLARRLEQPDANYLMVRVDADTSLDLTARLDIPDLLAAVVDATERAVLGAEGKDPTQALQEGYLDRLWSWLQKTDVVFTQASYSVPSGPNLVAELRARPTLRARFRETVSRSLPTFLADVRQWLHALEERAVQAGRTGIVVVVDSLEKLRGIGESWDEVLQSAARVFSAGAPYLRLPVHVIYTVPVVLTSLIGGVEFMPVIKLRERDGTPSPMGQRAARELIRRRVPDRALAELLGPEVESRVNRLIEASGGYPRELVRMLRLILESSQAPLDEADFQRVIQGIYDELRLLVPEDAFAWLARVAHDHYLTLESDDTRERAARMMSANAVLTYRNGETWFDVHPGVRRIPGVARALEELARGGRKRDGSA